MKKTLACFFAACVCLTFSIRAQAQESYIGSETNDDTGARYEVFTSGNLMLVLLNNPYTRVENDVAVFARNWLAKQKRNAPDGQVHDGVSFLIFNTALKPVANGTSITLGNITFTSEGVTYSSNALARAVYKYCFTTPSGDAETNDALSGASVNCKNHKVSHQCSNTTQAKSVLWSRFRCTF